MCVWPGSVTSRLPNAEATPFALPELPVSIQVRQLAVETLSFAPEVFGQGAEFNVTGTGRFVGPDVRSTELDYEFRKGFETSSGELLSGEDEQSEPLESEGQETIARRVPKPETES